MSRQDGFSPEQIVLGKSPKVSASLTSDEQVASHSLADGSDLDYDKFRRNLEVRTRARKMFLLADNDAAIRRALLRKSCPPVDTYTIGQHVMYWRKRNTFGRREVGRWHGPARIVCRDGSTTMWIANGDKLLRCAPENLRPASLREWSSASVSLDQQVQDLTQLRDIQNPGMPPETNVSGNQENETYSPGSFAPETAMPVSQQSSQQPESEYCPEPLTNSLNTPITGPQDKPTEDNIIQLETNDNSHNTVIDLDATDSHDNNQDT